MFRRMIRIDYGLPADVAKLIGRKDLATSETGRQLLAQRKRNSRLAKAGIVALAIGAGYFGGLGKWNPAHKAYSAVSKLVTGKPSAEHNGIFTENGHTYHFRKAHLAREGLEYAVSHSTKIQIPELANTDLVYLTMQKNGLSGKNIDILADGDYWLPVPLKTR